MGKPLTVDISSDVKNLDQVIPGSACQPVSIVVPFHTHHSSLVGMAKFRKDCVKVKLNSHMLSSRNIIAQFLAMTTCVHNAHGHTRILPNGDGHHRNISCRHSVQALRSQSFS